MIYLDTSAAMKLVRPELYSRELSDWLKAHRRGPVVSSVLIEVELIRATRRSAPEQMLRATEVLRAIGAVTVSPSVVARAAAYLDVNLRSLDAIHIATAEHVVSVTAEHLDGFVTYDDRLLDAARAVGLPALAPGIC